jgi:pimeloyl-ACP methyl ester carboxylesterase
MDSYSSKAMHNTEFERGGRSIFISASDGLRLHVREHGVATTPGTPVVCLPGLTRTTVDFGDLAPVLAAGEPPRRVVALDSRGRGQSAYDPNPKNYTPAVELLDLLEVLKALTIPRAVFVGSSRGGILTMLLAAAHPEMIAGAVLHDIGPVIEPAGIARIKSYVGKLREPSSLPEGADTLRGLFAAQFPKLTAARWLAAAERTWKMEAGKLVPTHDLALAETLADFDIEKPLPPLWKEFDGLAGVLVLVIRGANSDILSTATVREMQARHPDLQVIEIADQGHVPFLDDRELIQRIGCFVTSCERKKAAAASQPAT